MSVTPKKPTVKKTVATPKPVAAKAAAPAKKPAAKKAAPAVEAKIALVQKVAPKPEPTHEDISRRAYEIWQGRGYSHGNQHHDWWQAEQDLKRA